MSRNFGNSESIQHQTNVENSNQFSSQTVIPVQIMTPVQIINQCDVASINPIIGNDIQSQNHILITQGKISYGFRLSKNRFNLEIPINC